MKTLLIASLLLLSFSLNAQWVEKNNGLYGGEVNALAVNGTSLFAGTYHGGGASVYHGGIFRSTDNGLSWSGANSGLPNISVNMLTVNGTNLYAGTDGSGVYRSTDNGTSWTALNTGLTNLRVLSLLVTGSTLFAGTYGGGVFVSTNSGASWTAVNTGLSGSGLYVKSFAIIGSSLFAGTYSGVFMSVDGTNWTAANTGMPSFAATYSLTAIGTSLFAGTDQNGVYKSTDNGGTWTNTGLAISSLSSVNAFMVRGSSLFAGTSEGVFASADNGTSWTAMSTGMTNKNVFAFAANGSNLFTGTFNGVFASTDSGTSWTGAYAGLTNTDIHALTILGNNLFAGTYGGGAFLSTDNGASWTAVNSGLQNLAIVDFETNGGILFAATGGGVFRSTNNGTTWTAANTGLTTTFMLYPALMESGGNLYAGTWGGGVFVSANNGNSWKAINNGLTELNMQSLAMISGKLYAGGYTKPFVSTDNGASWSVLAGGFPANANVRSMVSNGNFIFAGLYGGGVYRSSDNGNGWVQANNGLTNLNVESLIWDGSDLLAATYGGGIFRSSDNGATWAVVNTGLTDPYVRCLSINEGKAFAGTDGNGVWSRPLSDFGPVFPAITSFTPAIVSIGTPVTITGINFDPTPTNNTVMFNGVTATVTGASLSTINTKVPAGATTGQITVMVGGHTATSTDYFYITAGLLPPTITSFFPETGDVGTTVTITGTYFGATPADNIVFFGATQAVVSSATGTQLTVTVPVDATYAPITVLNTATGLMAYSLDRFLPTFTPNKGTITSADFDPKVDLATATYPTSVAIGDLDGDGKSDLAVATGNSSSLSLLRNTSTGSGISYAAYSNFIIIGGMPETVSIGDLDGDGKGDMVVTNFNGLVSVFRNTSTGAGNISFAPNVDFTAGAFGSSVSIGDLDGDGKADLAVTNENNNSISILRNISTGVGNIAYATKLDFTTGLQPYSVSMGDLDGDGKADLAVANFLSNSVSVFRNTSTGAGNINYASKMDFTCTNPTSVSIGDLDGDGKADLVAANYKFSGNGDVSVFRNSNTGAGNISFDAKVDFTIGSRSSSVAIGDLDGDGLADLAVANSKDTTVSILRNTSTIGNISYAAKVDFVTGLQPSSVSIGDLDGDGKADLALANYGSAINGTVSIIRNNPIFLSTITPFITTWRTDSSGTSAINQITLPITGGPYDLYWEEVSNPTNNSTLSGLSGAQTVTFPTAGTYKVQLSGSFASMIFNNSDDIGKLLTVEQWGSTTWQNVVNMFYGCSNLNINATDAPDLSAVTSTSYMFANTGLLNPDLSNWNVSNIADMSYMFSSAALFDGNVSTWDVSQVTNMSNMFAGTNFNQPLNNWNVSAVTNMSAMFFSDLYFDQPLANWNVSAVTSMSNMFMSGKSYATNFNQPLNTWNVSAVTDMSFMFFQSYFNQPLDNWNVSAVTTMSEMFTYAYNFNQPLNNWNVSAVTDISGMFIYAGSFNQPLDNWNVSAVTNMNGMFAVATSFNQPIDNWNVSAVTNMSYMFSSASSFNQSLDNWNVSAVTDMHSMFTGSGLSNTNYDNILVGWEALPSLKSNVTLDAPSNHYCAGQSARAAIISNYGWTINDLGFSCAAGPTITINTQPSDATVCEGITSTFTIDASGTTNIIYQWQYASTLAGPYNDVSNGGGYLGVTTKVLSINTTGTFGAGFYKCRISGDLATAVFTNGASLVISPLPAAPTVTGASGFGPVALTLIASGGSNGDYRWYNTSSGGTAINGEVNSTYVTPVLSAPTTYYVSIYNGTCESVRMAVLADVKINQPPVIADNSSSTPIGGTATLNLDDLISDPDNNLDLATLTVITPPSSGATAIIDDQGKLIVNYTGIAFCGSDKVTIGVCDTQNACSQKEITIEVVCNLEAYNAISSNDDSKNDIFYVQSIELIPETKNNKVTVYNRWGDLVFSVDNYNNVDRVFGGLSSDGTQLPTGTYFYKIEFSSGRKAQTGFISLKH